MKKSLLLLSLLVSANIFSVNPSIPQSEFDELERKPTSHEGRHRRAGETHKEFLEAHGGSLPLVPAHQTGEQKHLHNAVSGKHGKQHAVKVTSRQTRAERRAARSAKRHAVNATTHAN